MEFTQYELDLIKEWVVNQDYTRMGKKTTVVCFEMKNGFEIIGMSACVNPDMYDEAIGVYWATKDALSKLEPIVGYALQEKMYSSQE